MALPVPLLSHRLPFRGGRQDLADLPVPHTVPVPPLLLGRAPLNNSAPLGGGGDLTYYRVVGLVMSVRALKDILDRVLPSVTAKGAYGNVTEELFVLTLLLCSLVPLW